jgi:ZIP family zinc transporter
LESQQVLFAFALTLFAGLSTGIGSAIAYFAKRTNKTFLSAALGFSAGVMIYISFAELFPESKQILVSKFNEVTGSWITVASFFGGVLVIALIDRLVPAYENPHEVHSVEELSESKSLKERKLLRMGMLSAVAIAIHNFPEGIATFAVGLKEPGIAIPIAIAIAIHNIPEGIAISVPIFFATGNRKKAFFLSFLSGLAEPLGAIISFFILKPFLNETVLGIIFSAVAGIMVFISLDELLPTAKEYGKTHTAIYGLIIGMIVMALSLLFFI